jgi:hypothetical protein
MSTTQWESPHPGPAEAAVTLVEYGDYECPYCGAAYLIIKELHARMGDRLRFVFRNFPITTSHPMPNKPLRPPKLRRSKARFGRCTTFSTRTRNAYATRISAPTPRTPGSKRRPGTPASGGASR